MPASAATLRALSDSAAELVRRISGMPDYDRFVAQLRLAHPECPIPSRADYFAEYVKGRYEYPGARCC